MEPVFSLKNVEVRQGTGFTLAVETLDLREGCIYTVTGPNGAGKSTLLRTLGLLTPPNKGILTFQGQSIQGGLGRLARLRREITLVEQSPYLFNGSVYSNLAFGLRIRGFRGEEQQRRIASALKAVGLEGFEQRKTGELSGGEVQRVALARALVLQPRVLLLDEPTANIDRDSAELFEKVLTELPGKGVTVIITSHDPDQHRRLGSEIIRLASGRPVPVRTHLSTESPRTVEGALCLSPLKMQEV